MKLALRSLDRLLIVRDCPDVDDNATAVMSPLWRGVPTPEGNPSGFQRWRKYERTAEFHDGVPIFQEVMENESGCPPTRPAMSTSNTPLTDAAEYEALIHDAHSEVPHKLASIHVVNADFARTLETRLHAAEELLREAWGWLPRECHYTSAKGVPTMLINNISRHFAAHLASATTTKETQP